ncbi:hypothetical protein ALP26_102276 [Pseudomonas savastanoi pv. glycinea]|uniref:Uncharacterized protein n=8 Tax=Pseudomonas syringae group TaxID=136849 RepID=A0AAX1VXJ7_PSEAJ|nr:Unknown protein sequence [Pseudomonas savastanoi pv. phaseolicola]KPB64804.1 Unknown protein sequence [Pseudomonas amygdali pv. mellea]KPB87285.1 Unknown protein sequence [Pseudomonas syringae pv. maculicola]KPC24513.1 Unknown protein sequence [Pseudomonas savastanoi pv. glycinea]KPX55713.1 hypothetical protein ALO67_101304 [Pseudomonas amygdali pv. hibisci]KPX64307.1 hypothetical protein ALO35_101720 [Pseudomonas amygdali pv. lachrymans]KPY82699.1 hypothetical protein ALO60_101318 [Pseudo
MEVSGHFLTRLKQHRADYSAFFQAVTSGVASELLPAGRDYIAICL